MTLHLVEDIFHTRGILAEGVVKSETFIYKTYSDTRLVIVKTQKVLSLVAVPNNSYCLRAISEKTVIAVISTGCLVR